MVGCPSDRKETQSTDQLVLNGVFKGFDGTRHIHNGPQPMRTVGAHSNAGSKQKTSDESPKMHIESLFQNIRDGNGVEAGVNIYIIARNAGSVVREQEGCRVADFINCDCASEWSIRFHVL